MAALAEFQEAEDADGVRFDWNVWPTSQANEDKMVLPLACLYTPFKAVPPTVVQYDPIRCKGPCNTILNPHCLNGVDVVGKLWVCPFCFQRNSFPAHYSSISATNLPAELIPKYTTIEYMLNKATFPAAYVFVVDVAAAPEELASLKTSILMALNMLPDHVYIGLITFGSCVQVYELGFDACPKAFVFRGRKDYTMQQITQLLGLNRAGTSRKAQYHGAPSGASAVSQTPQKPAGYQFLCPKSECELTLETILEELQVDAKKAQPKSRPLRSTGAAVSVAVSLLEAVRAGAPAKIQVFMGGPCTQGPGLVVEPPLSSPMRMHFDLQRNNAKHLKSAKEFYNKLALRVAANGHSVDLFSCAYDQVGILEMANLAQQTNGAFVFTDEFQHDQFKESFKKMFAKDSNGNLKAAFNATIEVQPSLELKVSGAIGNVFSLKQQVPAAAKDRQIGIGGTNAWKSGSLDPHSNIAVYFQLAKAAFQPAKDSKGLVQFKTLYTNSTGKQFLRVTTVAHAWASSFQANSLDAWANTKMSLCAGFDQEAAAVLMARTAIYQEMNSSGFNTLQWLDKSLIKLCSHFGDYVKGDSSSFTLSSNLSLYPQFMFHLRRSPLLQRFNSSPDESLYYRNMLLRENVTQSMTMIQPTLEAYSFDSSEPFPVLLSATSVSPDRILLLDTFFHVCIFSGSTIADWRMKGYHNDPNYQSFKLLLDMPKHEAAAIIADRFPRPRFVECDQGSSQARFLLAVIDPAITHTNAAGSSSGEVVFTEDVNLQNFMDALARLATETKK